MDAEGPGDFSDGDPFLQQPSSELELIFVHLLQPPEAEALPGVGAAGTGAFADEITLELSYTAIPAKKVIIVLPAWVVVSAHGSEMDWKRAPA